LVADLPLEHVACHLCGRSDGAVLVDDPPFKVRLCAGCGLGYTSPRVAADRIHEIYADGYFRSSRAEQFGYACYADGIDGYLRTVRRKARLIRRFKEAGSVLEVGCAAGAFLEAMREIGFATTGIEVSEEILETARRRFGLRDLHCGRLDTVDLPAKGFD